MAYTSSLIKRHITSLSEDTIFTTRDMLAYGPRNAVDKTMQKLVKAGCIYRLTRGVFTKNYQRWHSTTAEEVARIKTAAFGKPFSLQSGDVPKRFLKYKHVEVFATTGRTTSFRLRNSIRVVLKALMPRNLHLGDNPSAKAARQLSALSNPGWEDLPGVQEAFGQLSDLDQQELLAMSHLLPHWITDPFNGLQRWRYWASRMAMEMRIQSLAA